MTGEVHCVIFDNDFSHCVFRLSLCLFHALYAVHSRSFIFFTMKHPTTTITAKYTDNTINDT